MIIAAPSDCEYHKNERRMVSPLVSIIIPTKNRCDFLCAAIDSIRAQTYANWEAIVVDDHSSDDTVETVRSRYAKDSRIKCLPGHEPGGACACRNYGASQAGGDIYIFMDSDEILAPFALKKRVGVFLATGCDFVVSQGRIFHKELGDCSCYYNEINKGDYLDRILLHDNPWLTTGCAMTSETCSDIGPWNEDIPSWQDWEFFARLMCLNKKASVIEEADYWIRTDMDDPVKIGVSYIRRKKEHHLIHRETIRTVWDAVENSGNLNSERKQILEANVFWLCSELIREGARKESKEYWPAMVQERGFSLRMRFYTAILFPCVYLEPYCHWRLRKFLRRLPAMVIGGDTMPFAATHRTKWLPSGGVQTERCPICDDS